MQFVDKILFQINTEIEKLGIDDCMGIDSALHMMRFIQPLCDELRKYILAYQFADETEEISFFKEYKPEVLSKYLYYNKIYVIESKYPTGSDIAQREYLYKELDINYIHTIKIDPGTNFMNRIRNKLYNYGNSDNLFN